MPEFAATNGIEVPPVHDRPAGFYFFTLQLVRLLARLALSLGSAQVVGREHVPGTGGFVLASNHASHFDPPVLAVASPRQLTYLAKIELFRNPIFSRLIRSLGAFPIARGQGDRKALETALAFLANGHALVVFPEGTRTRTGEMGKIRSGAAVMALKARAPIVPAYIEGTFQAWPKGGKIRPAPVRVRFGPPLSLEGLTDDRASIETLTVRLEEALTALQAAARSGPR